MGQILQKTVLIHLYSYESSVWTLLDQFGNIGFDGLKEVDDTLLINQFLRILGTLNMLG